MLNIMRFMLFHVLLIFHKIITLFLKLAAVVFIAGGIGAFLIPEAQATPIMKMTFLPMGLGFSILSYYFTMLVLSLKPDDGMTLILMG